MIYSTNHLFTIILIVSVIFILFLCSPVYKIISGKRNRGVRVTEGFIGTNLQPCIHSGVNVPGWWALPNDLGTCIAPSGQKCCNASTYNGEPVCRVDFARAKYDETAMKGWVGGCITPSSATPAPTQSQQSTPPFFKLEDAAGIKQGKYNNISFNTFGLNSNLNNWTITIILSAMYTSSKWQGIIGNIYNSQIPGHKDGWGFWINPSKYLHFRISDTWAEDFTSLGQITENIPYKIIISFNNNAYQVKLIRMSDNANNIVNVSNKPKLTTDRGSICLGGGWENLRTELFDGNITYVDFTSPNLQPTAPASIAAPVAATPSVSIPNPTSQDKASFESKKCNNLSTRDGNCIPVCVPINGGSVVGPPRKVYGNPGNAVGPDGLPFSQNTANYFYERNDNGSGGQYYPITDMTYTRMTYGADTDCTKSYECAPIGSKQSDGSNAKCSKQPEPPKPTPSGPCDPSCRKVKDPRFAGDTCKLDKSIDKIVCYACPLVDGEINCNNYMATCSGCGDVLRAQFDPGKDYPSPEPKEQPFTRTECEVSCDKPGVQIFQNYLNTFRDGAGFDDGSCEIIGRNMIKCRPVRKGTGAGANGGMNPIPSIDDCVLCDEEYLHGYATFERKWDNYTKQNNYTNVKLVDGPQRRRGASYGPSDGSGGGGGGSGGGGGNGKRRGRSNENWERWTGGGSGGGGDSSMSGAGWYQSMSDVKSKSHQVASANAASNQQQAYTESLKLELNKLNDEYTTQKVALNKMKSDIDKQISACQGAKSRLNDAMRSRVSDDMNKNAAITIKEKIDANARAYNIRMLEQSVRSACNNTNQMSNSYHSAMKRLEDFDIKRQVLVEKLSIATNKINDDNNKTTININLGGFGGMGDCGNSFGCGTGIEYNNMYTNDMVNYNYNNTPMPYQDIISL